MPEYDYPNYSLEQEKLRRRYLMAQALSGAQMPQGQMVGGHYVAPSPWAQLATVGQQLAGAYFNKRANQDEDALKAGRQKQIGDLLRVLADPGMSMPTGAPPSAGVPAITPNSGATLPGPPQAAPQSIPGVPAASPTNPPANAGPPSAPPVSPQAQQAMALRGRPGMNPAALQFIQSLPLEQQEAIVGQQLFPKPQEDYTLKPGETRFRGAQQIAALPPEADKSSADIQGYKLAKEQGYPGSFFDYQRDLKRSGATTVSTQVNTEKSLYGTLADKQAEKYSELYQAAQAAPEMVARAGRIRELLAKNPYTGTGADYKLAIGKAARSVGLNYAEDDATNTEALMTEMARSTLDSIKSSGLAGSQGLTEGERKFLQDAVAGRITLEPQTIQRLSQLNERTARLTLKRWNDTAGRLDPKMLQTLGMTPVAQPAPPVNQGPVGGKLIQNPDGSYTYSP